jgi:uncharacterized C2H2 Zn-finger protein
MKNKGKMRTCPDCGKKFKKRKLLLKHGRTYHDWNVKGKA